MSEVRHPQLNEGEEVISNQPLSPVPNSGSDKKGRPYTPETPQKMADRLNQSPTSMWEGVRVVTPAYTVEQDPKPLPGYGAVVGRKRQPKA